MKSNKQKLKPYLQACPAIFSYQIATKALIGIWVFLLGKIFILLLKSSGRVAVTSGDYAFLFTTWQGILMLLLTLVSLFVYVAFDLNTKIALSSKLISGESPPLEDASPTDFVPSGK